MQNYKIVMGTLGMRFTDALYTSQKSTIESPIYHCHMMLKGNQMLYP